MNVDAELTEELNGVAGDRRGGGHTMLGATIKAEGLLHLAPDGTGSPAQGRERTVRVSFAQTI